MPRGVYVRTEAHGRAISLAKLGKYVGEKNCMFGKHHTPATRKKQSFAHLGKPSKLLGKTYEEIYGVEKATQMRKAKKGNKNALGKPSSKFGKTYEEIYSVEKATQMRENMRGEKSWWKKADPKLISIRKKEASNRTKKLWADGKCNPRVGYKHSDKTKQEIGLGNRGKKRTLEIRENQSKVIKKLWQDPKYREAQIKKIISGNFPKPNYAEKKLDLILQDLLPNEYRYVGNGEAIIAGKNPDFININGKKKIIEMFGDFWHKGHDPEIRTNIFRPYGFETLVVWERELQDVNSLNRRLQEFHDK